jgi:hypothetical protein
MILVGYRHGLRASELCDLQWSQVELATGRLHVRRAKNGSPSVHPMQGDEIRAVRRLQREQGQSSHQDAVSDPSAYAAPWLRLCACQCRPRYAGAASVAWPSQHSAHGPLHRTCAGSVQGFLAIARGFSAFRTAGQDRPRACEWRPEQESRPGSVFREGWSADKVQVPSGLQFRAKARSPCEAQTVRGLQKWST